MKAYFYPKSIYTSVAAFADLWNNMTTRVFDPKTDKIVGVKKVPFTLTAKEKIASILASTNVNDVDPQKDNYLPRITCNMSGMTWDPNRMRGKYVTRLLNIEYNENGITKTIQRDTQSMPWNLTFEVVVWTKYQVDAWQLFENIAVWFGPESHVSFKERNFGLEHKSKVTLDSVIPNVVYELGESERRIIQHNYIFTMETVLYKPIEITPEIACAIIKIANVPCEKIPFEGGAIIVGDNNTQSSYDPFISTAIRDLDQSEQYDLMVKYWESANNSMSSITNQSTYMPCVMAHCDDTISPRPTWETEPDPCGLITQPTRLVRENNVEPSGHNFISTYNQKIVKENNILRIVSYRTTLDDTTNEIIEQDVIIPNEEYPECSDFNGDGFCG
jgi:hypothetical protein